MHKRVRVILLTFIILLITTGMAQAISITGNSKIDWLIERGYVTGDSRGFRLNDNITRAEATKMIVEVAGLGEYVDSYKYLSSMFKDVSQSSWANGYINVAVINQLVNGYPDGTFAPSKNITYAEVIKMLVIANGDMPTNIEMYSGPYWSIPYIVKAEEVGITENVNIALHNVPATREKVFEMVFNTMFKEEPLELEKYNGIIMGNYRVSKLDDTEISLLIFEDLNNLPEVNSRYRRNDKIEITLPVEIEDVEYLIGKVVDVTIDNNNVVQEVKIDKSYSYLEGPVLAYEDELYLGTNGEYYRVDDELQVYHNDEEYEYIDLVNDLGSRDKEGSFSFLAEYAKLTVKKGNVYFLDSFTFDDITPVGRVSRNEILIYDDSKNGGMMEALIDDIIAYTYDWGFEGLEIDRIREGDILHIYDRDKAIVRRDSKGRGMLNEIFEYMGYYFADIDGGLYQVRVTDSRRPVYSNDGTSYKTLYVEDLEQDIFNLYDQQVNFLLDINGHIQAIYK